MIDKSSGNKIAHDFLQSAQMMPDKKGNKK